MSVIDIKAFTEPHYPHYKYMMFMMPVTLDAKVIVETGFADGCSSNIFLSSLSQLNGERTLHTFENFQDLESNPQRQKAEDEIKQRNYSARWILHRQDSAKGIQWDDGKVIDLLYLDSNHSLEHVYDELAAWTPFLTPKAIVMIDDAYNYSENRPEGPLISSRRWFDEHSDGWKELVFPEKHGPVVWHR